MRRKPGRKESLQASNDALVIVHLSSLDSYTDLEYMAAGSRDDSYDLAASLAEAVLKHKGPVFIVDQLWYFIGRESRPRGWFLDEIGVDQWMYEEWQGSEDLLWEQGAPPRKITWIRFDENEQEWDDFLKLLEKQLKASGATSVTIGGLFYCDKLETGCVTHTYQFLKDKLPTKVNRGIVGTDYAHYPRGKDLPGGYTRSQKT